MTRMIPVAEAEGVQLHGPEDGRYSFFNSPFPAHLQNTGVDLYPSGEFGGSVNSPITGEVVYLRKVKAPSGHGFEAADHDYVIVVRNRDNPDTVTKLLHIEPIVEVGDIVKTGELIGTTLRSGYYGKWTSPHLHAEIRKPEDPIRARGGYNLQRVDTTVGQSVDVIEGEVVHAQPELLFMRLSSKISGLVGRVQGESALFDGGVPYYGWLGMHLPDNPSSGIVTLLGREIGDITHAFNGSSRADCREFFFSVNGKPILGLSLTLCPRKEALIKVIAQTGNQFEANLGDWIEVILCV